MSKVEATDEDAAWLEQATSRIGAVVGGRWTYEAAGHCGDENPWGLPFFIVTHRPDEQPAGEAFTFVDGVEAAVERFTHSLELEQLGVRRSRFATFIDYRVASARRA